LSNSGRDLYLSFTKGKSNKLNWRMNMTHPDQMKKLTVESGAVTAYLSLIQGVISRVVLEWQAIVLIAKPGVSA
jgi:hypothetical protein